MLPPIMAYMESKEGEERTEGRRSKTRKDDQTDAEQQGHEKKKAGDMTQLHLSRLVFLFGHVAICHLNYLDVSIFNELKRRNTLRELKKEKKNAQKQVNLPVLVFLR